MAQCSRTQIRLDKLKAELQIRDSWVRVYSNLIRCEGYQSPPRVILGARTTPRILPFSPE